MGVAHIHFHPHKVLHCNSNEQLTVFCHIFTVFTINDTRIILVVVV